MRRGLAARLARADDGVTIVEFALVSVPLLLLLLGGLDMGFEMYMSSMLQGTMDKAARQITVGGVTQTTITTYVTNAMRSIMPGTTVTVTPLSYYNFSNVRKMEPITTDYNGDGVLDSGDCFTDYNNNGTRDSDAGAGGTGGSDDVVYYEATATFPSVMPFKTMLGWPSTDSVKVTSMMRNQPYAAQPDPVTVCKP